LETVSLEALRSVGSRLDNEMKGWAPVADVMQMLVDLSSPDLSLSAGPSISKAIELCADDFNGLSQSQIRKRWRQFRDVAHLLAAGALLACEVPEAGRSIFAAAWYAPDSVLAIAAGLEQFGLGSIPHGQAEPFLPPATTWRLPPHCIPSEPWLRRRALSERQKNVLATYKAQKPYIRKG
jgi:hypothetical protein